MLNVAMTDGAERFLRSEIAAYSLPRPGVVITRQGTKGDLVRDTNGQAKWTIEHPYPWRATVISLDGLPVAERIEVRGITICAIGSAPSKFPPLRIGVVDGELRVHEIGA